MEVSFSLLSSMFFYLFWNLSLIFFKDTGGWWRGDLSCFSWKFRWECLRWLHHNTATQDEMQSCVPKYCEQKFIWCEMRVPCDRLSGLMETLPKKFHLIWTTYNIFKSRNWMHFQNAAIPRVWISLESIVLNFKSLCVNRDMFLTCVIFLRTFVKLCHWTQFLKHMSWDLLSYFWKVLQVF